jgi:hypothetical protein
MLENPQIKEESHLERLSRRKALKQAKGREIMERIKEKRKIQEKEEEDSEKEEVKVHLVKERKKKIRSNINKLEEDSYAGLALCHRPDHKTLEQIIPELSTYNINWVYVNVVNKDKESKEEIENLIIGDMFALNTLDKANAARPEGYDFVMMPFCPLGKTGKLSKYYLVAPLIASAGLMREAGVFISTNLLIFSIQLLDPVISSLHTSEDKSKFIEEVLRKEKNIKYKFLIEIPLSKAIQSRVRRLKEDNNFIEEYITPFFDDICRIAGFSSWDIFIVKQHYCVKFIK